MEREKKSHTQRLIFWFSFTLHVPLMVFISFFLYGEPVNEFYEYISGPNIAFLLGAITLYFSSFIIPNLIPAQEKHRSYFIKLFIMETIVTSGLIQTVIAEKNMIIPSATIAMVGFLSLFPKSDNNDN
jgi:hypothetical protein